MRTDIRRAPRDTWPQTPVSEVMIPLQRLHAVSPDQRLSDVLPWMAERDVNQLPVVQNGHLAGC
ncbi:MAG TPA: CBS domain-containing protein [Ktedonobacterales bacterium]|jgi:CBS domain-containing protein